MEAASATMMTFGVAMLLLSWIVLMIAAWREDYAWGLATIFLPPLSYLYGIARLDKAGEAILLAIAGWALILLA
jgi:hypothetical protein